MPAKEIKFILTKPGKLSSRNGENNMRYLRKFLFAFALLPLTFAACSNAQIVSNPDISTDEAVLAELQKRADANREKLGLANKNKLDAKNVCIERFKESTQVIVIGFFRSDYGCHFEGAFVGEVIMNLEFRVKGATGTGGQ